MENKKSIIEMLLVELEALQHMVGPPISKGEQIEDLDERIAFLEMQIDCIKFDLGLSSDLKWR